MAISSVKMQVKAMLPLRGVEGEGWGWELGIRRGARGAVLLQHAAGEGGGGAGGAAFLNPE